MAEPFKIAVAGLGTVGVGTLRLLMSQRELLEARCQRPLVVSAVSARDKSIDRGVDLSDCVWFDDAASLAAEAEADVVVELIGGSEGVARRVCEAAIDAGRHVVTANKALIAMAGTELAQRAEARNVTLGYEAAVCGGMPIIKVLREGLAGNRITRLHGILNGTCNYILSQMRETGREFEDVLAESQRLGYAEADPSFDIDGIDSAHKLAILTSLVFGCEVNFDAVYVEGIRQINALDVAYADELGYRIKLLGITERSDGGVYQRVHPTMVPRDTPIAAVEGVFNAVVSEGDFAGATMMEGRGAGAEPTASAVVGDILDIACGRHTPTFGVAANALVKLPGAAMENLRSACYLRLMVVDRPGVFADIAAIMRDEAISMEAVLQRVRAEEQAVPVVITTHDTEEAAMQRALTTIDKLDTVRERPTMIRIENFAQG
jgi:homoserine dehydrogenase